MRNEASNNPGQAFERTPDVRLSRLEALHSAHHTTITTHHITWGKRVLAVPHDTSERLREHHS